MNFSTTSDISQAELQDIVIDEIARRKVSAAGPGGVLAAGVGAGAGKTAVHAALLGELFGEFDDIRNDPARQTRQMDQMGRTYEKYLEQGNDPVEMFIDRPGQNVWAAGQDREGNDIVILDSTAPHPAVMAHELGHVQMNHSNDPLSFLQRSGLGRMSQGLAMPLGAAGGYAGYRAGGPKNRALGAVLGGLAGTVAASGNFAYELGGASGRALGYLPEDVDQMDAAGDLLRAGMTYGMAGPGTAAAAAIAGAGVAGLTANPDVRRFAGRALAKL